jgi:hypothetical protein
MRGSPGWHRWLDLGVGVIGLITTFTGWCFDHVEHFEWIQRLVAPRYFAAIQLYDRMFTDHQPVHRGDAGFEEIVSLVKSGLQGEGDLTIGSLQITDNALSFMSGPSGMFTQPTISLTVTLTDGRSISSPDVPDLKSRIKDTFLQPKLFKWGTFIFCVGLVLSSLALVHSTFFGTNR